MSLGGPQNFTAQTGALLRVKRGSTNEQNNRMTGGARGNGGEGARLRLPHSQGLPSCPPSPLPSLLPRSLPLLPPGGSFPTPSPSLSSTVPPWTGHTRPPDSMWPPFCGRDAHMQSSALCIVASEVRPVPLTWSGKLARTFSRVDKNIRGELSSRDNESRSGDGVGQREDRPRPARTRR